MRGNIAESSQTAETGKLEARAESFLIKLRRFQGHNYNKWRNQRQFSGDVIVAACVTKNIESSHAMIQTLSIFSWMI